MAAPRSLILVAVSLRYVVPSFVRLTTGISCAVSFTCRTLGTSTCNPNSITWAVSMKMISNTSTTSTNGVMLISASGAPPRRRPTPPPPLPFVEKAILRSEIPFGHVQELQREVFHARTHFADAVAEQVIEHGGRNGREEPHGGGNQRFGNAGRDRREAGAALFAQSVKCADDAHDRSQ